MNIRTAFVWNTYKELLFAVESYYVALQPPFLVWTANS
jgi:hypothetical protein